MYRRRTKISIKRPVAELAVDQRAPWLKTLSATGFNMIYYTFPTKNNEKRHREPLPVEKKIGSF